MRRQCFSFAGTFTASYSESLVVDTTYTLPLNAEKESVSICLGTPGISMG